MLRSEPHRLRQRSISLGVPIDDADDAAQTAALRAWRSIGTLRSIGTGPMCAWLDSIVRHTAIDMHRGYSGVRGLNALRATASTSSSAPVILGQRLRQGKTGSAKGAARIVGDALATLRRTRTGGERPLLRADSAFYGHATIGTALKAGADVSVTVRMDPAVKAAIATIPDDAWTMIEYTDSIRDETTGQLISKAEVAEVPFTAFRSRRKAERVPGRLVVRRIPDLNPKDLEAPTLFDTYRHHAFFTTTGKEVMDTVDADKTHRGHAIIEQVHSDLKNGPLGTCPPGCSPRTAPGSSSP